MIALLACIAIANSDYNRELCSPIDEHFTTAAECLDKREYFVVRGEFVPDRYFVCIERKKAEDGRTIWSEIK
jgi:hypothetical protein